MALDDPGGIVLYQHELVSMPKRISNCESDGKLIVVWRAGSVFIFDYVASIEERQNCNAYALNWSINCCPASQKRLERAEISFFYQKNALIYYTQHISQWLDRHTQTVLIILPRLLMFRIIESDQSLMEKLFVAVRKKLSVLKALTRESWKSEWLSSLILLQLWMQV